MWNIWIKIWSKKILIFQYLSSITSIEIKVKKFQPNVIVIKEYWYASSTAILLILISFHCIPWHSPMRHALTFFLRASLLQLLNIFLPSITLIKCRVALVLIYALTKKWKKMMIYLSIVMVRIKKLLEEDITLHTKMIKWAQYIL